MAKKSKKQTRKVSASSASKAVVSNAPKAAMSSKPVERRTVSTQEVMSSIPATRVSSTEFNPDYSQTIKDLKRIGVLAGSFFFLLVIISFFLR